MADRGPWFRSRPRATIAVAAMLFAGVFVLRITLGDAADGAAMLYVLPIALVAVAFGLRAGLAAGLVGVLLVALWVVLKDVSLTPLGWVARALPMLLLGCLLGDAADRLRIAEAERRALEVAARGRRDAIEVNDTIVQGMSAAKWSLESGDLQAGLAVLTETLELGHALVSDLLRSAQMGPTGNGHRRPGVAPAKAGQRLTARAD